MLKNPLFYWLFVRFSEKCAFLRGKSINFAFEVLCVEPLRYRAVINEAKQYATEIALKLLKDDSAVAVEIGC